MLEDMGNAVRINGETIVPAVNIQVENVPGYLEHTIGPPAWYGVYFEVMFETGTRWIVEQRPALVVSDEILVGVFLDPPEGTWLTPLMTHEFKDWDRFVQHFNFVRSAPPEGDFPLCVYSLPWEN